MLGLLTKPKDKRAHKRVVKSFNVRFRKNPEAEWMRAKPMDLSVGGLGAFLFEKPTQGQNLIAEITLDATHKVVVYVEVKSSVACAVHNQHAWRVGFKFLGVSQDDWHLIHRWAHGKPLDEKNVLQEQLKEVQISAEDMGRMIPKALLDQILGGLVQKGKLAPLVPGKSPLVQYFNQGMIKINGKPMYRIRIKSRVVRKHGANDYSTLVRIGQEDGQVFYV